MEFKEINEKFLREQIQYDDNFYDEETIDIFLGKLRSCEKSCLIGLLGPYGSGKSTFLEEVKKQSYAGKNNDIWVHFDAWQYPDRKELWDGFVLQMTKELVPKKFNVSIQEIAGEKTNANFIDKILGCAAAVADTVAPGLSNAANGLKELLKLNSAPISRIFQYEELLEKILFQANQDEAEKPEVNFRTVYVVLEDIDRSGEDGILFIETVKNFIDRHYKNYADASLLNKMILICPIAVKSWQQHEKYERYMKVFSSREYFPEYQNKTSNAYMRKVFKFTEGQYDLLKGPFQRFAAHFSYNYRHIKSILRHIVKEFKYVKKENDIHFLHYLYFNIAGFSLDSHSKMSRYNPNNQRYKKSEVQYKRLFEFLEHENIGGANEIEQPRATVKIEFLNVDEILYVPAENNNSMGTLRVPNYYRISHYI